MGKLAWYKAEPQAFLTATRGMPFELKCAYRLVIDLIYAHDAKLPDDERFVAGQLGCDVRVWRRLRVRLLELGKLYVEGAFLRNPRCDREVTSALRSLNQKRTAGLASASKKPKSDPETNGGNGLASTDVPTEVQRTPNDYKNKILSSNEDSGDATAVRPQIDPVEESWTQRVWRRGVGLLGEHNRALVGKARKALLHDDFKLDAVLDDLQARIEAEDVFDPVEWFAGAVANIQAGRERRAACGRAAGPPKPTGQEERFVVSRAKRAARAAGLRESSDEFDRFVAERVRAVA